MIQEQPDLADFRQMVAILAATNSYDVSFHMSPWPLQHPDQSSTPMQVQAEERELQWASVATWSCVWQPSDPEIR